MSELTTTHGGHSTGHDGHGAGHGGHGSGTGIDSRKLGVWAFIGSETLFFAALITVYLIFQPVHAYRVEAGIDLVPMPVEILELGFTTLLASILLASSVTMVLALSAIRRDDIRRFRIWMLSTIGLGLTFLGGQVYEFNHLYHEGLTLGNSMFGTTFYVLTGFHGTHVAIGVIWLLAVYVRSLRGRYSSRNDMDVELAGLYWHFVDLVWIVIFALIYLLPHIGG